MKYSNWQDLGGLFHLHELPTPDSSENSPTFTAEVCLFSVLNGFEIKPPLLENLKVSKYDFRDRFNGTIPCHFSHDNMTGLHCMRHLGFTSMELPIIRWDSTGKGILRQYWLHPRDIITYLSLSFAILSPLALLLLPIALVSYVKPREATSGKCLWFLRFGTMSASKNYILKVIGKIGLAIGNKTMLKYHGENPFEDVFSYYFKDVSHPCRVEIKEWYRE